MEQGVLKPQNLPEQLRLRAESLPAQGCPSIPDLRMQAYQTDPLPAKILEAIRTNCGLQDDTVAECMEDNRRLRYRESLYVPDSDELRLPIIQEHHDTALAGHPGLAKMFNRLDQGYHWQELRKDIDRYVQNCQNCQRSRGSRDSTFAVQRSLAVPDRPCRDISMHFVVGLPECEGFDTIWVVVDRLLRTQHFIPCHTTIDALGLAKLFLQEVVCLHGLPLSIVSDRGPQGASTFWHQMCSRLGIDRRMSTAFHPQTDGQTEGMNASMQQYLRVFVTHQQDDWVKWQPLAEFAANNGVSERSKCTPLCAIQGTDPRMSFVGEPTMEHNQRRVSANNVEATMQQIHDHLRVEMRQSQAVQAEGANRG